jgi:hypothetical protein
MGEYLMEYASSDLDESYMFRGYPEHVIKRLWKDVKDAPRMTFPHLVGEALITGGEIVELEANVVFMKRLRKEVITDEWGRVEFIIPIEVSTGPEGLLKKLRSLLLG